MRQPCAQEAPSPGGPPPASDAPPVPQNDTDAPTLNVNVNLVNLYFSVRDKDGFITNLHKDDCALTRGQRPADHQELHPGEKPPPHHRHPARHLRQPDERPSPRAGVRRRVPRDVLTPKDEAFLISFDINVDLLADYTNRPSEIKRAIDKAQINTGAGTGSVTGNGNPRGTLLFDAVYLAANDKLRQEAGRKILVLLTDGGDQGSQETLKTATEAAQKANAIIYVILIADRQLLRRRGFGINLADTGARDMEQLATDTGGRVINVGNNGKKLEDAFNQIQDELRTQYLAQLHPHQPQGRRHLPHARPQLRQGPQNPGPQRLLRHLRRRPAQLSAFHIAIEAACGPRPALS